MESCKKLVPISLGGGGRQEEGVFNRARHGSSGIWVYSIVSIN